jgi:hypothetical protein
MYMKQNNSFLTSNDFFCLKCDFKCNKKGDWNRHVLTQKHKTEYVVKNKQPIIKKTKQYSCYCGTILNSRTTLWRHKNKCDLQSKNFDNTDNTDNTDNSDNNSNISSELIIKLLSQNNDLHQMLIEQNKQIFELTKEVKIVNNTTNNTTNNNNFNLQVFLNDTCKDAVNLVDFVESLQLQLKDLEETARLGYSEGVSRIFINGLNELDVNKRPIHCSDAKRETLYIKDQDEWTKEDTNKTKISKAIKTVGRKNIQQIFEWQKKNPEYKDPESKQNDKYLKMVYNTMSGSTTEEQEKNMTKIIKNITKEVIIDKNIVS